MQKVVILINKEMITPLSQLLYKHKKRAPKRSLSVALAERTLPTDIDN
ncbi:hypothetical protein AAFN90_15105 [Erwiniaceae bacterium CAU 1747]